MPVSEAKRKADARYKKKAYERIGVLIRRDAEINGDCIRAHAEARNESTNGFIIRAIRETIERDKVKIDRE